MRLLAISLSAALLSGCSWFGYSGHKQEAGWGAYEGGQYGQCASGTYGQSGQWSQYGQQGAHGAGCYGANGYGQGMYGQAGYGQAGYGQNGYGSGAYGQNGYSAGGANGMYGAGYGQGGYGAGMSGAGGAYGATGYGSGAYGTGAGMTGAGGSGMYGAGYGIDAATGQPVTLGSGASYGSAVGTVADGQYAQYAGSGTTVGGVQQVMGAPIYVQQPYPVYYSGGGSSYYQGGGFYRRGGGLRLRGGQANPIGLGGFVGGDYAVNGNIFGGKSASPNNPDETLATARVDSPEIAYDEAFEGGTVIGGGLEYDASRNTTVFANLAYQKNEGATFENGTFEPGTYDGSGNFTSSGPVETVTAEMSDLEQITIEGGVRQYVGGNLGFRPYVGASAGFTHNNRVDLTQSSSGGTLAPFTQSYIDEGWSPTAAGIVGAEMAVGPNAALGVETGLRWRDDLNTNVESEDRWSVPLSVRGRIAF